jgi:hypothetical protein
MIKISFLGDVSLNDYYNDGIKPFKEICNYLSKSDFVVGNLECMSIGNDGENLLKKPRLKTNTATLNYLKDINLTTATLAHNHVYDNLQSGFECTTKKLDELHISYLGAGLSTAESKKHLIVEKGGIKVTYLNYVTDDTNPNIPKDSNIYLNEFNVINIKQDIIDIKKDVDYIVCIFHWGGRVEKGMYPDHDQPKIAYEIIDAGADLIIGHHSHTLQPYEVYKGKYIFYSLGNFCFADINSDGKLHEIDRDTGCKSIIVNVEFYKDYYNVIIQHIKNEDLFIKLDNNKKAEQDYQNRIKIFNFMKNKRWLWKFYWIKHKHYNPIKFYFFGNERNPFKQLKKWVKITLEALF